MKTARVPLLATAAACGLLAWSGSTLTAGETVTLSDEARAEAKSIFQMRCTPCHGAEGKGDGVAAAALTPPPRNLSEKAWQESVKDDYIEKIILKGGPAVEKSPLMPPNPDLESKPAVVSALREYVRKLRAE